MVMMRLILAALLAVSAGWPAAAATLSPKDARIEVVLDERGAPPVVREMVLATLRVTFEVEVARYEVEIPRMPGLEWMQLTQDVWRADRIEGRQVRVMERRLAFFPQRAGVLTIAPVKDHLSIPSPEGGWDDHVISSAPVTLAVAPAPVQDDAWWMPVKMIEMSDRWDKGPGQLEPNATVTRRVTLWALGATAEMLPPQPQMREPWLITFVAPEKRTTELTWGGPISTVTWQWTFQPITGEPGVLPAVEIPFYDTLEREAHVVTLPAVPIAVTGFAENRAEGWREGFGRAWLALAAAGAGVVVALGLALPGARMASRAELERRVRRVVPSRAERAMMRAARRGDLAAFRTAAAAEGAGPGDLAAVDRALFGPPGAPVPERAALRALARRLRADALRRPRAPV
ncbi:BatD family protein [Acuticoccus yangtzensis]|uniref:BatD family protein n=1 Tax=Acuticoccus yangtzensis TaxID=1443441 RepID=UPI000949590D|nr:BatD family protein [Acuticoccus yangtzensis]